MSIEFLPGGGSDGGGGAEQDTGWRYIERDDAYIYVRRIGNVCFARFNFVLSGPTQTYNTNLGVGWQPAVRSNVPFALAGVSHTAYFDAGGDVLYDDESFTEDPIDISMTWLTDEVFPTSLPGVAYP